MKKTIILFSLISLFAVVGCNPNEKDYIKVIDMSGTEVHVPKKINKIACISQPATDFLLAFGQADKIVGTYRSFLSNTWAKELCPKVNNFKSYAYSVSAEQLLSDGVDLVILQNEDNVKAFRNAGLPVLALHQYSPTGSFNEKIYDIPKILGQALPDIKDKCDTYILELKECINSIKNTIGSTVQVNKNIYYINGEKKKGLFYSDGGNSMISSACNISNTILATEKYTVKNVHEVSDEEILAMQPYSIIIGGAYQNRLEAELKTNVVWKGLSCVSNNRVYRIPICMTGIENVSVETPIMLKYMASLFNDGYEFDLNNELIMFTKKYFNYTLSMTEATYMSKGLDKNGKDMIND